MAAIKILELRPCRGCRGAPDFECELGYLVVGFEADGNFHLFNLLL